jgi:hypothetical protein
MIIGPPPLGSRAAQAPQPVQSHLERDDRPGDHADRKADSEDPPPEPEHLQIDRCPGAPVHDVDDAQEYRQPDGDRRERHVEHDGDGELPPGQVEQTHYCSFESIELILASGW